VAVSPIEATMRPVNPKVAALSAIKAIATEVTPIVVIKPLKMCMFIPILDALPSFLRSTLRWDNIVPINCMD